MFDKNNNITYGLDGNYKILDYSLNMNNSSFSLIHDKRKYFINLNLPCLYNIYNYVAALSVLNIYGFSIDEIIKKTKYLKAPAGRMDLTNNVIIDYAHTPDAILNVLKNVRMFKTGKIITIIGCGGNRDKLKRPIIGEIATNNSDYVIFTNDNPRNENEEDIMKDITYNLSNRNYEIIYNREEAIKKGISIKNKNDILLILGKGHEKYQIIKNSKIHFDDKEILLKYLK